MNEALLSQLFLKDTAFHDLMRQHITNVLLIASTYDAFMMEEDGRVEEQIFFEYMSLNLSSPPRVTRVSNYDEAFAAISVKKFDLIIAMPGVDVSETFVKAKDFKRLYPDVPFVVLTPFSREVSRRLQNEDFSAVDYVFSWLGNVDLLVAIIKLIEDKMNADNDISQVGIQMILLVEDSVRFYSSILPTLYNFILRQSQRFSTEALNAHETMMRMRGRPKVMLARNYGEAVALYDKYRDHILGVISDVSFARDGVKDKQAGLKLARYLRSQDANLPIIIESSDVENAAHMQEFDGTFLDKNSKKLPVDLGNAIMKNFGFGDFVIINPATGEEIMRIHNLKELQDNIFKIPADSLLYHARHNHISRWLYSRALFPIAQVVKMHHFRDISEAPAVRQLFFDLIVKYRKMKNRGVVAEFHKDRFDRYSNFARIGKGSLGGKGRGLAFIDSIIKNNPECDNFEGAVIRIPHTVVLCTDIFDEFMEMNGLYPTALSNIPDAEILQAFLRAKLPESVQNDLYSLYDVFDGPLAVRSSSLLEDSHYQPFAGVYSTYMVPHFTDRDLTIRQLSDAVKGVYASVFFADSKAYMVATSNVIDQEKMAVIIQEAVGVQHGDYFYPSLSGVGRSLNYYPVGDEQPADGIAEVAVGLGKYIVDGGMSLRFSPRHPAHVLQTSTLDLALRDTQRYFYALSTTAGEGEFSIDEGFDIARLNVDDAGKQGFLKYLVSTYDYQNERIVDSDEGGGRKVVTFANVLRHDVFPLAQSLDFMLTKGQQEMGRPVEIEFAMQITGSKAWFYLLQIRPIVDRLEEVSPDFDAQAAGRLLLESTSVLGNGQVVDVQDVVYVRSEHFDPAHTKDIARELDLLNERLQNEERAYVLVGPGRWGSSDPWLGIPVKWPQISGARIIVECGLSAYRIDPSQGTHFFQNLTSLGVGYFTIRPYADDGSFDEEWLNEQPAVYESHFLRQVHFSAPLCIQMDGRHGRGGVWCPAGAEA